jgi:hypothetical protein
MAELKNLTVQALRELARKALGRGHSRLRTKAELVAALQAARKNVSGAAGKAAARVRSATERIEGAARAAERAADELVDSARGKRKRKKAGAEAAEPPARAAPAAEGGTEAEPTWRSEPDAEGYFVARVRGEEAVRDAPHPMTESSLDQQRPPPEPRRGRRAEHHYDERLGELPAAYADDSFLALPRDPRTLYVYWDHARETVRGAFEGLARGRAQLWIYAQDPAGGWDRVRAVDFALESRSYFVHDLDPGRVYRAEIHLVDEAGRDRLLSATSNAMMLPPFGPSPIVEDRFMRIPWGEPLNRLVRDVHEGPPFPEDLRAMLANLSDWARFVGPTWGSGLSGGPGERGGGEGGGAGGPGGRPSGPSGGLALTSSPTSPWGAWGANGSGSGRG